MYRPPKVRPKNLTFGGRYICHSPFLLRINGVPEVASSEISRNFFKLTTSVTTSLAYAYDFLLRSSMCTSPLVSISNSSRLTSSVTFSTSSCSSL